MVGLFILGFVAGLMLGVPLSIFVLALCDAAKRTDEQLERMERRR